MTKPAFLDRQKPGTDYGALKSLVFEHDLDLIVMFGGQTSKQAYVI